MPKPKNFNDTSMLLWGNIILDWQWAIQTLIWKECHEESKIL